MLDKTYRPDQIEAKHYAQWEKAGAFAADTQSDAAPYTIMMPPPNVTGSLHMGHALNSTIQDLLIRYHRMRGRDALWQPGMDHAGIATQMVVERQLAEDGKTRHDLGREKFVERVWEWKAESGGQIIQQLRRLGASADWAKERFTMDEGLSAAVRRVFVDLHKQGLIYRDKRLVNWDCKLHTAISDLEVEQRETKGHLWHFRYPIEGEDGRFIVVATTRPETMLGDTAVAVHPEDDRYKDLIGKFAVLPIVGRRMPIVADDYADPEQGSGAVKITPAHDFNDFEVGQRHDLELINIFDENACLNENAPEAYRGLDRYAARKQIIAELETQGLLEKIDDHIHMVPFGDRSGVAIEPWLTDQWFVDAATLAKPCIEAVEQGKTVFVPKQWENTYFAWMRDIQPWCVSRQLWWGHQIPAWYGPDGEIFVALTEEEAQAAADAHYGKATALTRDPDVLDTWFSSALWPFSTLGWPDENAEVARYYPGDVLVTGFDIIFFWVARMMMMGMHFMGGVPFHTVYIHALVRDEKGQKMSKSKGNILDPLVLVDKFGADAVRFTLTALAAQGRDIRLAESRLEGYRNFATKVWNAARFCEMNECVVPAGFSPAQNKLTLNRWITSGVAKLGDKVADAIEAYRFNEAAHELYHFAWHSYCDWYLEFAKPVFQGTDADAKAETRATALWVLHRLLHLLHPMMPFITEELWDQTGPEHRALLIASAWPKADADLIDDSAEAEMDWVTRLVSDIRAIRSEMNVPAKARMPLLVRGADETGNARLKAHGDVICALARLDGIEAGEGAVPKGAVQSVLDGTSWMLPLADVVDLESERARLKREIDKLGVEIGKLDKKLANTSFLEKAPEHVVEEQRERKTEAEQASAKLADALERIGL